MLVIRPWDFFTNKIYFCGQQKSYCSKSDEEFSNCLPGKETECNINQAGSVNFYKFWVTIANQEYAGPFANIDVRITYKFF